MSDRAVTTLYEWILQEFTPEGRAKAVGELGPHLAKLVKPGCEALDLCCGAGPFAFYLEERGARVTAVDVAPFMIGAAQEEASRRGSRVDFVLADVLAYDLGAARFDLAAFLGNTVSDFALDSFARLAANVNRALKRSGRFAIHYLDGLQPFVKGSYRKEGVQQEEPVRITHRFKEYLPERGAYVEVYRNEATGETFEYTSYVYTPPVVRLLVGRMFTLEESFSISEGSFLDIFLKR